MTQNFDAIVLGAGVMGNAAAYYSDLARQRVLLEQFELNHQKGSFYGYSRVIRYTHDHPTIHQPGTSGVSALESSGVRSGRKALRQNRRAGYQPTSPADIPAEAEDCSVGRLELNTVQLRLKVKYTRHCD